MDTKIRVTWVNLSEVKSLSRVQLFATPWTVAYKSDVESRVM